MILRRCLFALSLALASIATASAAPEAAQARVVSSATKDSTAAFDTLFLYCYQVSGLDAAQLKAHAEACKPMMESLKATLDADATLRKSAGESAQSARTERDAEAVRQWGKSWNTGLIVGDVIVAIIVLLVSIGVLLAPEPSSLLREPAAAGVLSKVSFARVLGLVGGLASLTFIGVITNVCLSYFFLTGKMPDQLGSTYATAVSAFFTAIIPYLVGKVKS